MKKTNKLLATVIMTVMLLASMLPVCSKVYAGVNPPKIQSASYNAETTVGTATFYTDDVESGYFELYLLTLDDIENAVGHVTISEVIYNILGIMSFGSEDDGTTVIRNDEKGLVTLSQELYFGENEAPTEGTVYIAVETENGGFSEPKKIVIGEEPETPLTPETPDEPEEENEDETCVVSFVTNGGTQIANQLVDKGSKANKPENPTKDFYKFEEWCSDEGLTQPFNFDTPIVANTTLYVKWSFTVKVESKDETQVTEKATEEVTKLIEEIVSGKEVEGMDVALVGKINDAIAAGKEIKVEVTTPKVEESAVKEDAEKVKGTISEDAKVAAYYDIDVNVLIDGELAGTVTKLNDKVTIILAKPEGLPEVPAGYKRIFKVVKVHAGVATELATTDNGESVSCDSDEFSTYALTYVDVKEETAVTETASNNPKTGDSITVWISLMAVSIVCVVGTSKFIKKTK